MNGVAAWLDRRLPLHSFRECLAHKLVPTHHHSIWYYLGGVTLFLSLVQVAPGVLLLLYADVSHRARPCYTLGMAQPHELRCYDYVNHPYAVVRDALRADLGGIFERATKSATGRAHALAANLKVDVGALEIGTDVVIEVLGVEEREEGPVGRTRTTFINLRWKAAHAAALFPSMEAELIVYPLSKDETQMELHGRYTPPLGTIGSALDSLIGHRVADASVHRFVTDVASLLRGELAAG